MGRTAHGVRGITLEAGDEVIGMETITPDSTTAILINMPGEASSIVTAMSHSRATTSRRASSLRARANCQ